MIEVPINKIKENILDLIDKVSNGEEVIVTRDKDPLVKITSYKNKKNAKFGSGKGKVLFISDDFDETPEEFKEYIQ